MLHILIEESGITATPSGFNKNIQARMKNFGGAQKPWKWDGEQWVIENTEYWAEKVKGMFGGWNEKFVSENIKIEDRRL